MAAGGVPPSSRRAALLSQHSVVRQRGHPARLASMMPRVGRVVGGSASGLWRQARAQAPSLLVRPSVSSRRRFTAAARWLNQASFLAIPR